MKKAIVFLLVCILCAAFAVAACAEVAQADIEKLIVGKWMVDEKDNLPATTNGKVVYTFESSQKAYVSASVYSPFDNFSAWRNRTETDVSIAGHTMTLTSYPDVRTTIEHEFVITGIDGHELSMIQKGTETVDGKVVFSPKESPVRLVKITDDFSRDIIGTWEGRCTSKGSIFDDGQDHRWEYRADGSFVYYIKDGGNWVPAGDKENEYFLDGILLCTRWVENNEENREWWEVSIDGDKMNWTALRKNEDGTPFTAAFEMTKVQ